MSRRWRILALTALAVTTSASAAMAVVESGGHAASAARSGVPAGFTTAAVERRTLAERSTVDGTLEFAGEAEIYDRIGGTFTWLPAVGAVIGRGGTLFKVNNLPIALMYGSVPAYRALKEGISDGPDVQELNANLVALGYDPDGAIAVNEHFSEATAAAVKRWQHAEGLAETGQVELGRIAFSPGARRVTNVHVVIGQDPPGGESEATKSPQANKASGSSKSSHQSRPSGSSNGSGSSKPSGSDSSGSSASSNSNNHSGSGSSSKSGEANGSGKSSSSGGANEGSGSGSGHKEKEGSGSGEGGGGAPELVLSTTANTQIVTLQLKATQQELAHLGEWVPVSLANGKTVHGRVSEVGTVASEASEGNGGSEKGGGSGGGSGAGNGENATISVKVTLDRAVARLDKAPVSVELVKAVARHVLAVPAPALLATGGGGFAVQVLEGSRRTEVAVTPGMFANGYVAVEGAGLSEGMTVLEPQ